jgi:hypothetical protein
MASISNNIGAHSFTENAWRMMDSTAPLASFFDPCNSEMGPAEMVRPRIRHNCRFDNVIPFYFKLFNCYFFTVVVYNVCVPRRRVRQTLTPEKICIFQVLLCSSVATRANTNPGIFFSGSSIIENAWFLYEGVRFAPFSKGFLKNTKKTVGKSPPSYKNQN